MSYNASIRTVIFDLDGTLYNYNAGDLYGTKAVADYAREQFGMKAEETNALVKECFRRTTERLGDQIAAIHSRIIRYQLFCDMIGQPQFPHAMNMAGLYWNTFLCYVRPEPGIRELLTALRDAGIKIMIGTNMTADMQFEKLARIGLGSFPDYIVTSEEAGAEKPSAAFFNYCLEKGECLREETLFVGDNYVLDYLGAKKAGLPAVWYRRYAESFPKSERPESDMSSDFIDDYRSCISDHHILMGGYQVMKDRKQ